jgi:hypothetical protein
MNKTPFHISLEKYVYGPYKPKTNSHSTDNRGAVSKAIWFPEILHLIPVGNMNLFQLVAGFEKELGPNQRELKKWILEQAHKQEPLRIPVLLGKTNQNLSKEKLAKKIMNHIKNGSDEMIFLPTLPVNPHIEQDRKESSDLFDLHKVPRIFPTALA